MIFKQTWEGANLTKNDGYFPTSVPGNIQLDYGNAHGFGDANYATNADKYRDVEDDFWQYRTKLAFDRKDGERVFFVSLGIDYKYDVALNGENIYSYEGMVKPFDVDLTDMLTGDDTLTVLIYPHPKREGARAGSRDEADASCKPPVSYGWDWNPRLLISGLWQDAYIETRDENYIGNVEVIAHLNDTFDVGSVTYNFDCAVDCVCALYDRDGNEVYRGTDKQFTMQQPNLWWCNGQGEPYLYRWVIENNKQKREGKLGFKRVQLVRNTGAIDPRTFPKSRYYPPITIELNGRRIYAKGSNWVNPDIFWGRITRETYDTLITMAKDANMNLLRVWGGASVNKKDFYELCDEYGIMVWQEFMLACNNYLPRGNYLKVLESEATSMIHQLRSHASLVLWCGGNELFNGWSGMTEQSMALRILGSLCTIHDPEKPFINTSPLSGMGHGGYMFAHGSQNGEVFNEFIVANRTAYTEFGVPSASSVKALKNIIPKDELFPVKDTPSWVIHHGFKSWLADCWVCLDVFRKYWGEPESLEYFCEKSQFMQAAGYQAAFEEGRRQWPRCSMSLNWCFNEPWTCAANNSLIEYPANPKPSYEAVKNSLRPSLFSARISKFTWKADELFEAELWLINDTVESISDTTKVTVKVGDTVIDVMEWKAETGANANRRGPTIRVPLPREKGDTVVLTLENENGRASTYTLQYVCPPEFVPEDKPRLLNM